MLDVSTSTVVHLTERLCDFRTGLMAAHVDLRKAFDSVNRGVLWRILDFREIPPKLVNLISVPWVKIKVQAFGDILDATV